MWTVHLSPLLLVSLLSNHRGLVDAAFIRAAPRSRPGRAAGGTGGSLLFAGHRRRLRVLSSGASPRPTETAVSRSSRPRSAAGAGRPRIPAVARASSRARGEGETAAVEESEEVHLRHR